ncbi:MAG: T9SS type A sorting domain-containing protein [Bacteroidetes bacterium]|nr:T9SS type A sorting domain-containing protein [Bacteroidota bacterium]
MFEPEKIEIYKGVYNSTSGDVVWAWTKRVNTGSMAHLQGGVEKDPVIAFDPSGQIGWIGLTGDTALNGGIYHPILFRTGDAGTTWTGPYYPDVKFLNWLTNWVDGNDKLINRPRTLFDEYDLVVDKNGTPRFIAGAWQSKEMNIQSNGYQIDAPLNGRVIEFSSSDMGVNWSFREIAPIYSKNFERVSPSTSNKIRFSNHLKAAMDQEGITYFASWIDLDTNGLMYNPGGFAQNPSPDLCVTGVNLLNNLKSCIKHPTRGHLLYAGLSFSPYLSSAVLSESRGGGKNFRLPVILPILPSDNEFEVPPLDIDNLIASDSSWFRDYEFSEFTTTPDYEDACKEDDITGLNSAATDAIMEVFPNPSGKGGFKVLLNQEMSEGTFTLSLMSNTGRLIYNQHLINEKSIYIPTLGLNAGIYLIRYQNGSKSCSRYLIIQ